jgi:hypothetical protein
MIYRYKYQTHAFDKLHSLIEHTVLNVWCKPNGNFKLENLHPDFRVLISALSKNHKDYLLKPIRTIYNRTKLLKPQQLKKLRQGFKNNDSIVELCNGTLKPLLFDEIKEWDKTLAEALSSFGKNLYNKVTKLKPCISLIADLDDYYDTLVKYNKIELCPFCGLNDIKSERLSKRDAFDHYLSKDKYPFISVHPLNLAPICSECNTSYKLQQDPIHKDNGIRRKAFFPFASSKHTITIEMKLKTSNIATIGINDIDINFKCRGRNEELDGWVEIFGLDERYKDKCCKDKDGKMWYRKIMEDGVNYGKTPRQMYNIELKTGLKRPLADNNFLRVPFLIACNDKGLI